MDEQKLTPEDKKVKAVLNITPEDKRTLQQAFETLASSSSEQDWSNVFESFSPEVFTRFSQNLFAAERAAESIRLAILATILRKHLERGEWEGSSQELSILLSAAIRKRKLSQLLEAKSKELSVFFSHDSKTV